MPSDVLYRVSRIMIQSYARLLVNLDFRWRFSLPAGPVLFAANHPSATDPLLIQLNSKNIYEFDGHFQGFFNPRPERFHA